MQIVSDKTVKTRKEHKCWGCGRSFPKGSELRRLVEADGGEIKSTYWCYVCTEAWNEWMHPCDDGIMFGDFKVGYPVEWEELRAKIEDGRVV